MSKFRWTHAKPLARANPTLQNGVLLPGGDSNYVRQGEVFTPTESELKAFRDRIEEVEETKKGKK